MSTFYNINNPPFTWIVCPVMYEEKSEDKNIAILAISLGEPNLFMGILFIILFFWISFNWLSFSEFDYHFDFYYFFNEGVS